MEQRLNKVLARAGICSRRAADRLIEEGRVTVNGRAVRELGTQVVPERDAIKVDGRRIPAAPAGQCYMMLNKPAGYVTTLSDPEGRPTIRDLVRVPGRRLFPVGRLDYNTEGLLLLTDDGPLSRDLMHPGHGVPKTYSAKVKGTPDEAALARLRRGVPIDRRRSQPAQVKIVRRGNNAWLEVTVKEGRKHQVRRMLAAVGHTVMKLKRIRFGGLDLSDLPSGRHRPLSSAEIERLRRWSEASPEGPPRRRRIS